MWLNSLKTYGPYLLILILAALLFSKNSEVKSERQLRLEQKKQSELIIDSLEQKSNQVEIKIEEKIIYREKLRVIYKEKQDKVLTYTNNDSDSFLKNRYPNTQYKDSLGKITNNIKKKVITELIEKDKLVLEVVSLEESIDLLEIRIEVEEDINAELKELQQKLEKSYEGELSRYKKQLKKERLKNKLTAGAGIILVVGAATIL